MRKLYTTLLLVSAILFNSNATQPGISAEINAEADPLCLNIENFDPNAPDSNVTVITSGEPTITIYPNPVKSFATITFTYQNVDRISIMNIVGREIKVVVPENGKNEVKVSLVDLQPGVYFLAAYYQGNTLITKKFLKED